MRRLLTSLVAAATTASGLHAQVPVIERIVPQALAPGKVTDLLVVGENLHEATQLWSTFSANTALRNTPVHESGKVSFRMELSPDTPPGIGAIQLVGSNGMSAFHLIMADSLPGITESGTNSVASAAQDLVLPIAVDGVCQPLKCEFFKFKARRGQRVCVEVVAQRLGSLLDPRVRLMDANGRVLVTLDDTAGLGADCAFDWKVPRTGAYLIELRDTKYEGGPQHQYRLRMGDIERTTLTFLADAVPRGLRKSDILKTAAQAEHEPDDKPQQADHLSLPATISGGFSKSGDQDFFEFEVQKDQRLLVEGRSRSIGSPCDLFLQIQDTNGNKIAEANVAGADEGTITNTFKTAGTYRLLVEELNRRGGPDLTYHVNVRFLQPGFELSVEPATVSAPAGGSFALNVKTVRRDYDGPIQLQLVGLGPGFATTNGVISTKTNAVKWTVKVPENLSSGMFWHFSVAGRAKIGEQRIETRASTLPALRKLFPAMPFPPDALDGVIGLGISAPRN